MLGIAIPPINAGTPGGTDGWVLILVVGLILSMVVLVSAIAHRRKPETSSPESDLQQAQDRAA